MESDFRTPVRPDTRDDGPMTGSAHALLTHWLDLYRETLRIKIGGLDPEQMVRRSVPASGLSLAGLVRHLTEVEAFWFHEVLEGEDLPDIYSTRESPDGDFTDTDPSRVEAELDAWETQVRASREVQARWPDLESLAVGQRRGQAVNNGWILSHLVEEYARHLGHADLLRESIDEVSGY